MHWSSGGPLEIEALDGGIQGRTQYSLVDFEGGRYSSCIQLNGIGARFADLGEIPGQDGLTGSLPGSFVHQHAF